MARCRLVARRAQSDAEQVMKISVCGKGGSGKSVITAMLAIGMRGRGCQVLIVDADESNLGLHRMLGFEKPPVPLLDLAGGKQEVKNVLPKTPMGTASQQTNLLARREISLRDIPAPHLVKRDGISLVTIGKIRQPLEGCACPMGVLSGEFLRKLRLEPNEVALADMEAGVEHFGRGVERGIDCVLIVVDPSFESVELAGRVNSMARGMEVERVWAVLNRVTSRGIASRLQAELNTRGVATLGAIPYDDDIFEACFEGRPVRSARTQHEIAKITDALLESGMNVTPRRKSQSRSSKSK
jgi:CO dehydrogenase maturation factor